MTNWVEWFRYQLKASGEGFVWAFSQINPARQCQFPPEPEYFGQWTPARHVWHVTEYERCLALPTMRQWMNEPMPPQDAWTDDDAAWSAAQDRKPEELVAAFRTVRAAQIALLDQLATMDWTTPQETLWGPKPLKMIVTKTYQHTLEHSDTLLRMVVWLENL